MSRSFRIFTALALVAHLMATLALAAAPRWHEDVHADAHDHGHECAVTLILNGGAEVGGNGPVALSDELPLAGVIEFFREEVRLPERRGGAKLGRGPPPADR